LSEPAKPLALLSAVADEIYKCNRCGFCQTRCPVYRITGRESSVARGHVARMQAALEGGLPFDDRIRPALFECLMCRACTAECPPAIETDRVVGAARASYVAARQSRVQRFIFRRLLASPTAMRMAARMLGLLKRTRLTAFSKLLRLVPWVDRGLAEGPAMMPAPGKFLRDRLAARKRWGAKTRRVSYFVGCAMECALPEIGEATFDVLEAAGYQVTAAQNACCGLPAYCYGDLESARALARENIRALRALGGDAIIADCASCSSFLKDYPMVLGEDDPMRAEAEAVAARVRDLSEFLASVGLPSELARVEAIVTYHDPCHLSRYEKITKEPRELLKRIPGIEYRELPEADWCCGGAGSYVLLHHDLSMAVLERKMNNIRATGAAIVVTCCPACIIQLRYGARRFDVPVEVVHLSEMLRRAVGAASQRA